MRATAAVPRRRRRRRRGRVACLDEIGRRLLVGALDGPRSGTSLALLMRSDEGHRKLL